MWFVNKLPNWHNDTLQNTQITLVTFPTSVSCTGRNACTFQTEPAGVDSAMKVHWSALLGISTKLIWLMTLPCLLEPMMVYRADHLWTVDWWEQYYLLMPLGAQTHAVAAIHIAMVLPLQICSWHRLRLSLALRKMEKTEQYLARAKDNQSHAKWINQSQHAASGCRQYITWHSVSLGNFAWQLSRSHDFWCQEYVDSSTASSRLNTVTKWAE